MAEDYKLKWISEFIGELDSEFDVVLIGREYKDVIKNCMQIGRDAIQREILHDIPARMPLEAPKLTAGEFKHAVATMRAHKV